MRRTLAIAALGAAVATVALSGCGGSPRSPSSTAANTTVAEQIATTAATNPAPGATTPAVTRPGATTPATTAVTTRLARPGDPAVYARIDKLTDCFALQREFDTAEATEVRESEAGHTEQAGWATAYKSAADQRMRQIGCF